MDLSHTPIRLSNLDTRDSTILLCQQLLRLCLPHYCHVVELADVVEQGVDDCVPAALLRPLDPTRYMDDLQPTLGNTKC